MAGPYYSPEVLAGIVSAANEASVLKGVGIATASAVLSLMDPRIPFMSDELLLAFKGKTDYTVAAYKRLLESVGECLGALWKGRYEGHGDGNGVPIP